MLDSLSSPDRRRKILLAASVFLLSVYYMFWQVNWYLAANIHAGIFLAFTPVLTAATLYFFRKDHVPESKLLLAYWIWFVLTRILCGDRVLSLEYVDCLDLSLMLPFLMLGLVLDREQRRRFLRIFGAVVGAFYFFVGLIALYTFERRILLVSPITEGGMGVMEPEAFSRILILDTNVNISANWFMIAFLLMLYLFFSCRKKGWRILIAFAALVDYMVVSITYTRSVKVALSFCLAVMTLHFVLGKTKHWKLRLRIPSGLAVFLGSFALFYFSHNVIVWILGQLSIHFFSRVPNLTMEAFLDPRDNAADLNQLSNGRIKIYKSAFYAIGQKPSVLFTGALHHNYMDIANTQFRSPFVHFHNIFLEALMLTGLPGLLLVLCFCLRLGSKGLRIFFAPASGPAMEDRILVLLAASILLYGLFDRCVFSFTDFRSLVCYLMAGFTLGVYRESFSKAPSP